jgi:hypothetical protein
MAAAMIRRPGGELGEHPEDLDPRPESHDVVGGAEEQPVGRHRRAAGHQPPQLPHLPTHQRRLRRTPPAPPVARRAPPPLHVSGNSEIVRAATTCVVCVGDDELVE